MLASNLCNPVQMCLHKHQTSTWNIKMFFNNHIFEKNKKSDLNLANSKREETNLGKQAVQVPTLANSRSQLFSLADDLCLCHERLGLEQISPKCVKKIPFEKVCISIFTYILYLYCIQYVQYVSYIYSICIVMYILVYMIYIRNQYEILSYISMVSCFCCTFFWKCMKSRRGDSVKVCMRTSPAGSSISRQMS